MVLVTMAVLTAVVAEFVYQTRVEVQMAANVRDRVKAYYLARSAINVARFIVYLQGQLDSMMGNLPQQLKQVVGGGTIKLYQIFPIESDLAKALTTGEIGETFGMKGLNLGDKRGFGEFDGSFHASIEDEQSKININALDSIPNIAGPAAAQILTLLGNKKYAPMFENADADGQYNTPADIVLAMHDWIDADTTIDKLDPEALLRAPLSQQIGTFFATGVSSEDSRYDTLKDPYKNKNLPFESVDELHLIRGVTDDFMQEFGDKFTVSSDASKLINLSSVNDPLTMLALLCSQPENVVLCSEQKLPTLLENLALFFEYRNLMQATLIMVPDKQGMQSFFAAQGTILSKDFLDRTASFSDTYSVQAQGEVGETTVTIRTIIKNTTSGQEIMYWRVM